MTTVSAVNNEPYTNLSINWTSNIGAVYGGYIDLISGELVQDMAYGQVTSTWLSNRESGYIGYTSSVTALNNSPAIWARNAFNSTARERKSGGIKSVCNAFNVLMNSTGVSSSQNRTAFKVDGITIASVSDFITAVETLEQNGDGLYLAYELETPITHQLTSTQLSSFIGQNNFWSNADYVEVEYELKETIDIQKAKQKIILNQPHIETLAGDAVNFTTDLKASLKECKVYFEPIQEGEGDPSPNNVRNITGWDGVEVKNGDNIYSIDWTNEVGTVYGGYVDLVSGELVEEWGMFTVNEPNSTWRVAAYNIITINFPRKYIFGSRLLKDKSMCTILPENHTSWNYGYIDNVASITNPHALSLNYTGNGEGWSELFGEEATNENVKSHLQALGFAICATLATPITHQLTPQQILSFKGINNFSCGIKNNLSVKYWNYKKPDSSNIAYEAKNLTFDGTNYINTGVYLFSEKNINRDFEVIIENLYGKGDSNNTIICAKHNGNAYGFFIRCNGSTNTTYKGTISVKKQYNNNIIVKRINGVISVSGNTITNPRVQFTNAVHNHPLVLGCAVEDDGSYYRYEQGTIGHIVIRWL